MAIVMNEPVLVGERSMRISWSGPANATYRVLVNGLDVTPTPISITEWMVSVEPGIPLFVEVLEVGVDVALEDVPVGTAVFSWGRVSGAGSYRVDSWNGSGWDFVRRILDDGSGAFSFETPVLSDVTSFLYRVVAEGSNGEAGWSMERSWVNVRHPDAPGVEVSAYDSGTRVPTFGAV